MPLNEIDLIKNCQNGQSEAFAEIYDRYFEKIYKFIYYKVGHRETAEDLCSLTFTKALESIKKFNADKALLSAWIYKIARNNVVDYYRSKKEIYDIDKATDLYHEENFSENMTKAAQLENIKEKLKLLTEDQREIIVMRVWNEMSYKEISEVVGKSENNCKVIFSRSLKQLRYSLTILIITTALLIS
jgi:RNA polymerase sigma-70 factor (ECF subfamily)